MQTTSALAALTSFLQHAHQRHQQHPHTSTVDTGLVPAVGQHGTSELSPQRRFLTSLLAYPSLGQHYCRHSTDVHVVCTQGLATSVTLASTRCPLEGLSALTPLNRASTQVCQRKSREQFSTEGSTSVILP